jgi:hypothetical protein
LVGGFGLSLDGLDPSGDRTVSLRLMRPPADLVCGAHVDRDRCFIRGQIDPRPAFAAKKNIDGGE